MIDDPVWAKPAGKTAMSINATELMWDFLEKHPKP
jgi:poly(3-hydroxybutyrate) depolymerase